MDNVFRKLFPAFLALVLCLTATVSFYRIVQNNTLPVSAVPFKTNKIIIDAGHGGMDGGAVGYNNTIEKDINLKIAKKLETMLTACGFEVLMTRETDCMLGEETLKNATIREKKVKDIRTRVEMINSHPDAVLLSIHQNLFSVSKYNGAQMFYSTKNSDSKAIATFLQNRFSTMLQKDNTRAVKPVGDNIYLMNHIDVPAVLIECGFISNALEASMLSDDEYQNKIAFVIYAALTDYFAKDIVKTTNIQHRNGEKYGG